MTYSLELGDWPGSTLIAFDCTYPETIDGGVDLVTPLWCTVHGRSVYWCLNVGEFWCDGGPPDFEVHTFDSQLMPQNLLRATFTPLQERDEDRGEADDDARTK